MHLTFGFEPSREWGPNVRCATLAGGIVMVVGVAAYFVPERAFADAAARLAFLSKLLASLPEGARALSLADPSVKAVAA